MTSRGMGDSTVRMREYVGYIIIFMGTACQLPSHPSFDAMHVTPLAVLVCHQWSYQQSWAESVTVRHIPQRINRETLLILGCRFVGKNGLVARSCPKLNFVTDNVELSMKEIWWRCWFSDKWVIYAFPTSAYRRIVSIFFASNLFCCISCFFPLSVVDCRLSGVGADCWLYLSSVVA
jgi:hypothetical protein